ncbi:hypothetical protein EGR_00896 [Echinococcus granulosus]|uniref:Uncharacterized protein n=1 Tax=Echinococcus granulosus TaxID=6210 RepID=W6V0F1_ECHGR|nr:hypothetical protein EGR_00896 [Echinococcus granulosus]EUB64352.1 hypothetical protein EGR_00896 [Echinococcus granulosus]
MIVEEEISKADSQNVQIRGIKNRLDEAFGPNWNCFMARSGCWALKTYKPGTNLVFEYEGTNCKRQVIFTNGYSLSIMQVILTLGTTGLSEIHTLSPPLLALKRDSF